MRRLRLRTGPAALFGGFLLAALLVFLPLRLVLGAVGVDEVGLSARRVSGSVWDGRLAEARIGTLALGDLDAHVSPWSLLVGRARVELDGSGTLPGRTLHGAVMAARHAFGVDDLTAGVAAGALFQPLPVTALDFEAVSIRFADGRCASAEGRVRATLGAGPAGIALPAQLGGAIRCDGAALLVPLTGAAGAERVTLRVEGTGRYRAEFALPAPDPATAERLAAYGFTAAGGAWQLTAEGRF